MDLPARLTLDAVEHLDALMPACSMPSAGCLRTDAGERRNPIIDLMRAQGLRFRDGGRWHLDDTFQVHLTTLRRHPRTSGSSTA